LASDPNIPIEPGSKSAARDRGLWAAISLVWLLCAAGGLSVLWRFDNAPGVGANAQSHWPADSLLARSASGPTVVLLAHPQCSCTLASLEELREALARADVRPKTYVLFLKPEGFANGWEQTDSWRIAAAIPDVTVVRDDSGREANRFGAATSGQTFLYDAGGALLFSGGITSARGHAGDNAGRTELVSLLNHAPSFRARHVNPGQPQRDATSVFGCPLFGI
jgi:hypothetical protein